MPDNYNDLQSSSISNIINAFNAMRARRLRPQGMSPQPSGLPADIASLAPTDATMPTDAQPNLMDRISSSFQNPAIQGLLAGGLNILATPPREQPYGNLEVLGRGGLAGLGAMNEAQNRQDLMSMKNDASIISLLGLAPKIARNQIAFDKNSIVERLGMERNDIARGAANKPISGRAGFLDPSTNTIIPGTAPAENRLIAPIAPKDYTPASVNTYKLTGNPGDLVPVAKPEANQTVEQLTREAEFGADPTKKEQAKVILKRMQDQKLLTPDQEAQQVRIAGAKSAASGAAGNFKQGTIDYMVEKYETDGQIPPFGMGSVGAKQRAAFFDKVAERAASRGDTGGEQAIRGAEFKSSQSTLTDLTKREQLINSYNVRINDTSDKVLIPLIKKWDLNNPRFLNWSVNKLAEVMGSGDLASLKLALNSVSIEVAKVEFNALGIQQLTDSASKFMNSVHDPNMKVGELLKVIDTSKKLGETGIGAISQQRNDLVRRMGKIAPGQASQALSGGLDMNAINAELQRRTTRK